MTDKDLELVTAFGDGWYSGFLAAKKISLECEESFYLDNYDEKDILLLSEHAESSIPLARRNYWSSEPPESQGFYWHWTGSTEDAPMVFSILKSGSNNKCFISCGQHGIKAAIFCDNYGGLWAKCQQPKLPEESK